MAIKIRKIFDASEDEGIDCRRLNHKTGEYEYYSLTKQSDKDACDINNILKRYEQTGVLPDLIAKNPRYGDFSDVPTLQDAYAAVEHAESQFMALSASVRERFGNDPLEMVAFCSDDKNREEMVRLGLALPQPQAGPDSSGTPAPAGAPAAQT